MSGMSGFVQIGSRSASTDATCSVPSPSRTLLWLQAITLGWMTIECGLSLYAATVAHSAALLAFGSDSLVELLSATVVLLQFGSRRLISQRMAGRMSGALLFALALIVACIALLSLIFHVQPESSCTGMAVTVAALIAMPVL